MDILQRCPRSTLILLLKYAILAAGSVFWGIFLSSTMDDHQQGPSSALSFGTLNTLVGISFLFISFTVKQPFRSFFEDGGMTLLAITFTFFISRAISNNPNQVHSVGQGPPIFPNYVAEQTNHLLLSPVPRIRQGLDQDQEEVGTTFPSPKVSHQGVIELSNGGPSSSSAGTGLQVESPCTEPSALSSSPQ